MKNFNDHINGLLNENYVNTSLFGGSKQSSKNELVGKKYIDNISLLRELGVELAHFDKLILDISKVKPMDSKVLQELQKAKKAIQSAYNHLDEKVRKFHIVMPDGTISK